jgi:threonine aldolase
MVKPRLVFISNSTELGTIYSKSELTELYSVCQANDLILYLDGARLGSALCSPEIDLTLADLAKLVDVFYIGGTKNGALLGEAIVINNVDLKENFRFHLKQRGALLAKGRILGIQFLELFKDGLYFELARHANAQSEKLRKSIAKLGYDFLTETSSNQSFPIFPQQLIEKISQKYSFHIWSKIDQQRSAIRLVTSWATREDMIDEFISDLKDYS